MKQGGDESCGVVSELSLPPRQSSLQKKGNGQHRRLPKSHQDSLREKKKVSLVDAGSWMTSPLGDIERSSALSLPWIDRTSASEDPEVYAEPGLSDWEWGWGRLPFWLSAETLNRP